jgi:hypothetical protein
LGCYGQKLSQKWMDIGSRGLLGTVSQHGRHWSNSHERPPVGHWEGGRLSPPNVARLALVLTKPVTL